MFDLVTYFFTRPNPIIKLDQYIIKISILSKFEEDWATDVAAGV